MCIRDSQKPGRISQSICEKGLDHIVERTEERGDRHAGQDHFDRADAPLIGQRIDEHRRDKRPDDRAYGQQVGIGWKYDERKIADKACAAGNADCGGRGHGIAHDALQNTAGQCQTNADKASDENPGKAQIPDDQPRCAAVVNK